MTKYFHLPRSQGISGTLTFSAKTGVVVDKPGYLVILALSHELKEYVVCFSATMNSCMSAELN